MLKKIKVHRRKPVEFIPPARDASCSGFALEKGRGTKSMKFWLDFAPSPISTEGNQRPRVPRPVTCKTEIQLSRKKWMKNENVLFIDHLN